MASNDDCDMDIDFAICYTMCSELYHYIEGLERKIIDFDSKEENERVKKRLIAELISEFIEIKESISELNHYIEGLERKINKIKESIGLDVGGPSQEEGPKADDVKIGTEFNRSGESSGTVRSGNERNREDVFDMASDSTAEEETYELPKPKGGGDAVERMIDKKKDSFSSSGEQDNDDPERQDNGSCASFR